MAAPIIACGNGARDAHQQDTVVVLLAASPYQRAPAELDSFSARTGAIV